MSTAALRRLLVRALQEEMGPPVLLPARRARPTACQHLLAVPDLNNPVRGNAPRHEVVPHRAGTPFTELLVVGHRAPLVGAPVDVDLDIAVALQPSHIPTEYPSGAPPHVPLAK